MTQVRAVGIPQEGWPCGSILSERPVGICSQRLGMLVLVFNSGQRKEVPPIAAALTQAILDPAGQTWCRWQSCPGGPAATGSAHGIGQAGYQECGSWRR